MMNNLIESTNTNSL